MDIFQHPFQSKAEEAVLTLLRELWQELKYALNDSPVPWQGFLRRSALARNIRGSNSIEGYLVSDDDAMAAVDRDEPFEAESETWHAVTGYRDAMSYVLKLGDDPHANVDATLIRSLHYMMMSYAPTMKPGAWRPSSIYVKDAATAETVYEAPDVSDVPALMDALIDSIDGASSKISPLVHASMAHLNLVMIHPFRDGNGRMARCLQTLVLARAGLYDPVFASVEEWLGANTPEYYAVLAEVGQGTWSPRNNTRPWIKFMLKAHYQQAATVKRRMAETGQAWAKIEELLAAAGIDDRAAASLVEAAFGRRIRNSTYRRHADVSAGVASRDLKELVSAGLLVAEGERRGRAYRASDRIREARETSRLKKPVDDPFDLI